MRFRLFAMACFSMLMQGCTPPSTPNASERKTIITALSGIPADPDFAYETSGGLKVAFYALYGTELRKCVENVPEARRAALLESLIDVNDAVTTTYIIRTFRELKLQMSEQCLQKLTRFVSGIDKFSRDEALSNEVHLYEHYKNLHWKQYP